MKSVRRKKRSTLRDEPDIEEGHGWVEAGGELILAGGFTEAGFPYGISEREFREANREAEPHAGWARARHAMERVCTAAFQREVEVGFVKLGGTGLSRDAFRALVEVGRERHDVYALVPNRNAEPDYDRQAVKELRLLDALGKRGLGIRVPRAFGALRDAGGVILVVELVEGIPLDLRAGRQGTVRPWEIVAKIAAEVHALPVRELPEGLLAQKDCRSHGESLLAAVRGDHELLRAAREWMAAHLPPPEPGVLLHGDLLGQNVHLGFDEPPGVLDWERAELGDPAYDLAVVTRGVRQPFQVPDGHERLLAAYSAAGGKPLSRQRIEFFELSILAHQLESATAEDRDIAGAETRLRALLKRLGAL